MSTYQEWFDRLGEQSVILQKMADCLALEKAAILENNVESLRKLSLQKDEIAFSLRRVQQEIKDHLQRSYRISSSKTLTLREIFETFPLEERRSLQSKRSDIRRLAMQVDQDNQFVARCLSVYLKEVNTIRGVFGFLNDTSRTYTTGGAVRSDQKRRLINQNL